MGLVHIDKSNQDQSANILNTLLNVTSREKLVLVDFWAPWCVPCKSLSPIIEKLSISMPNVEFVKVNVDDVGDHGMGVSSLPTLLFFQNGKMMNRLVGAVSESTLKNVIKDMI